MEKSQSPKKNEIMRQRGEFIANGYKFVVKPVYYNEESEYFEDLPKSNGSHVLLYPRDENGNEKEGLTDTELSRYGITLFGLQTSETESNVKKASLIRKITLWLRKRAHNYKYYSDNPNIMGCIKWLEKKVTCNGKKIKFYDLERKYGLTKSEIVKLFGYFEKMSGF